MIVVLLVCAFAPFVLGQAQGAGTLAIVNQHGGVSTTLRLSAAAQGALSGSRLAPRRAGEATRRGWIYGATPLIADGGSKSYSLEPGSYYVTLNFYKPVRGVYTMMLWTQRSALW